MIKIKVVVILMVAIMGITAVPIQASEKQGDSKKQENKATQVISDEEQELLKKEDIQVVSDENGNIKLKNTSQNTINEAKQAGIDIAVAGSAIISAENFKTAIAELK